MYSLRFVQNDSIFSMVFIFMLMMTFWRKENFFSSNIHSKSTNSPEESWPYVFKPVESCVVSLISPCFSRKTVMLVIPDQSRFQAYQEPRTYLLANGSTAIFAYILSRFLDNCSCCRSCNLLKVSL